MKTEKEQIEQLLEEKYLNGVANNMNTHKILEFFHPDFAIFSSNDRELVKFPLREWKNVVDAYKADNRGKPGLRELTHKLDYIDVAGNAATVKLLLSRHGELIATDYISLLKIGGEWKVVTKVAYSHVENPFQV
ncbi:nuclear transport factor 2 family protein [Dysgonomonas sp. ZJ709]|uniref:nuclear transport factor 2 family protein n=1 Tax=Dysgonomonas sp. ZJ709 TaxID=2709797 RepID=UPI0013EDAEA9|nr:nuclear transport factor 2 family protein [Dysgonomonas sp. ZJ709]